MSLPTLHAVIHGNVQGVGFRYSTLREAEKLGVGGWVRNREDGTVEVLADGNPGLLKTFLAWLEEGPPGSSVTRVEADWGRTEEAAAPHFTILG